MSLKVGEAFNSYEDFNNSLLDYSGRHFVLYTIADSQTVDKANLKLTAGKTRFSDRFKYRYILLQCKHAERNKKKKVKGLGLRPNQRTFNQACTAELYVSIDRKKDKLIIHRHNEDHNHPTDENMYVQYPEQRRLPDHDKKTAETMLNMGVKVKLLQDYLKSAGQHFVSVKDLHNIRQGSKKLKYGNKTDEEILIDQLVEMSTQDPDASISIMVDNNGVLVSLLIVTGDMKELFQLYPEIIFIDGTYSVNKLRMPMYSFVIEDGNGCGQSVGYAFVANERTETLEGVLGELGKVHDLSKVRVAVVDKALNEITAIKKVMPSVSIQLCKFHVLQAMTREIKKAPVDESTRQAIVKLSREMVFAKSEESFKTKLGSFAKISPQCLMDYYNKNWDKSKELWAGYLTNNFINLGNTTNNRIESHNQKVKALLDRNKSLSEAVLGILLLHTSKMYAVDHELFNQTMKVSYRLGEDNEVADVITKTLTPYASRMVIEELKMAGLQKDKYASSHCKCIISGTMGLPCRHIFAKRMVAEDPEVCIFREEDAMKRWHISHYKTLRKKRKMDHTDLRDNQTQSFTQQIRKGPQRPKSKEEKFKEAMHILKPMADYLSVLGTRQFLEKLDTIQYIYSLWCDGINPIITPQIPANKVDNLAEYQSESDDDHADNFDQVPKDVDDSFKVKNATEDSEKAAEEYSQSETPSRRLSNIATPQVHILKVGTSNDKNDKTENDREHAHNHEVDKTDDHAHSDETTYNSTQHHTPTKPKTEEETSQDDNETFINAPQSPVFKSRRLSKINQINSPRDLKPSQIHILKLPKTPPVRGRCKIKNIVKRKGNKENVFKAKRGNGISRNPSTTNSNPNIQNRELRELKNKNMLNDRHIHAASYLLKKQFPEMGGLQDPILGTKLQFSVAQGEFVQILHDGNLHWFLVSNAGLSGGNEVEVFDSLYNSLSNDSKLQIASLVMTREKEVKCFMADFQRQQGGLDCGLFAIAAATSLCYGEHPSGKIYIQERMRDHLFDCLINQKLKPFPSYERKCLLKRKKTVCINVYCICRLPDNGEERMVECGQCREWFHQTCMSLKTSLFMDKYACEQWMCTACT